MYDFTRDKDKKNRPQSAKFTEVFESCKHFETGADVTDVNDLGPVQLARLVKFFLLTQREIDMARIQVFSPFMTSFLQI